MTTTPFQPAEFYASAADILDRLHAVARIIRQRRGLTIPQAAEQIGIPRQSLSRLETGNGTAGVSTENAARIFRWIAAPAQPAPTPTTRPGRPRSTTTNKLVSTSCTTCGSPPGELCVTIGGTRTRYATHRARRTTA